MTVRIVMVCHGSTEALRRAAFPLDEGLDEHGTKQVADAAHLFAPAGAESSSALCGPSLRCRQTAAGLGVTAETDEGLRDCDTGHWAGRTLADLRVEDPEGMTAWLTDPAAAPHGGESVLTLVGRVAAWLESRHEAGGRVVAITHPAVIRAAVVHVLGTPPEAFWKIDAEPLSHVRLTAHGGRWRLRLSQAS
ncbi:histidine phosphatase family protein [Sphaerisporangium sp. NPDC088356]|uniref:histidine phosphatase family protein n=1 Tax=Sphaerisporangium sp. NPDC088356 TaxID=3154871 RepID=UPI0034160A8B